MDFSPAGLSAESVVNPYCLYDYAQLRADLTALEERYPQLIRVYTLGETAEGRPIPVFDFGRGDLEIVLISSMHACEHIATNVVMYLVDQYCQGYQADGEWNGVRYREILDRVKFRIMPMANPDGIELAGARSMWGSTGKWNVGGLVALAVNRQTQLGKGQADADAEQDE